jgi:predicted nucleic acid-binding protein
MIVVSDTSALSNLALVDHLWILAALYQSVTIPDIVAAELAAARNPAISAILRLNWIQSQPLTNSQLADQLQQERGLDAGEANAIALALELQADDLLIDERLGRQEAVRLGLSIVGILGILVVAKQKRLVSQFKPIMDDLINQAGFRVSSQLYQRVLALAQEPQWWGRNKGYWLVLKAICRRTTSPLAGLVYLLRQYISVICVKQNLSLVHYMIWFVFTS